MGMGIGGRVFTQPLIRCGEEGGGVREDSR